MEDFPSALLIVRLSAEFFNHSTLSSRAERGVSQSEPTSHNLRSVTDLLLRDPSSRIAGFGMTGVISRRAISETNEQSAANRLGISSSDCNREVSALWKCRRRSTACRPAAQATG